MSREFRLERTDNQDEPIVQVGPPLPGMVSQLTVLKFAWRRVFYGETQPVATTKLEFPGEKIEIEELKTSASGSLFQRIS